MNRVITAVVAAALAAPAGAQEAPRGRLEEIERKIEILSEEIERLKLGEAAQPPAALEGVNGLAPAASKVYRAAASKVSVGGYGEMSYQNFSKRRQDSGAAGSRDQADLTRAVLYVGYKFSDRILFNSELEFEHASTGAGRGEVSVEQAYLDFKAWEALGLRAGLLLVPMGLTNEVHEPTMFHGVRRPSVETNVIPSTWRENGAGIYGGAGMFSYRSYVMSGLQATTNNGVTGFGAASALRSGRSSGARSFAEDLAWVGRVDISPWEGAKAGAALYLGEADQGLSVHAIPVSVWEAHAQGEYRGVELKALYAQGSIGNADTVNSLQGFTNAGQNSVGSRFFGGYVEAAFNLLSLSRTSQSLSPFARYERYDTQLRTPGAFAKNPANSRVEYTLGLTYKPIVQIAVKADYQWNRNQARTGVDQFNLGIAYIF